MNRSIAGPVATTFLVALAACDGPGDRTTTAASGAASTPASAVVAADATRSVVTIDDAHDLQKKGAAYAIAPAGALVLEVGGYRFGGKVDAVHVAHGPSEYYRASWSGGERVTLDARSLDPVKGGAFAGFRAGEEYLVAVGREEPNADGVLRFAPVWTTTVKVAPR